MPTINEMIDFCEDMAAHDCFSNEQFARREMFYAIADELKKQNNLCENLAWYINERQRLLKEKAQPHGEWKEILHSGKDVYSCTECFEAYKMPILYKFCPNCGAKMGADNE